MSRTDSRQRLHGTHCVLEALRARRRRLDRVLVRSGRRRPEVEAVVREAAAARVPIEEVAAEQIGQGLAPGSPPQAVALDAGPLPEHELEPFLADADREPRHLLALDGVEDPQNVGALIRVAEAAGVDALILTRRRSPPLGPAVARASAGAAEWLPVVRVTNLPRALNSLKKQGFWVVGADPDAATSVYGAEPRLLEGPLVVVLGAEGRGLRPGVRDSVDHPLSIPMAGRVGSLNVATAGAVLLFELWRRRRTLTRPSDEL